MRETEVLDIQSARQGNKEAFGRIVERYQETITRQMWRFTHDKSILEELVQDVFVEAFFSISTFQDKAPFQHWLSKIATRIGYHFWKRAEQGKKWVPIDAELSASIPAPENRPASEITLFGLLQHLVPDDRLVLSLSYFEQLSGRQIAERTGWSEETVRQRTSRARKKLKVLAEKAGMGEDS